MGECICSPYKFYNWLSFFAGHCWKLKGLPQQTLILAKFKGRKKEEQGRDWVLNMHGWSNNKALFKIFDALSEDTFILILKLVNLLFCVCFAIPDIFILVK